MENHQLKHLAYLYLKDLYSNSSYYIDCKIPTEYNYQLTDQNLLYINYLRDNHYKEEHYINIWEIQYILYKHCQNK